MDTIQVKDRNFKLFITAEEIQQIVAGLAQQMNNDLAGKDPVFLPILNGAFMFASDLMKQICIPSELTFVKYASYDGAGTTGQVKELIGIHKSVKGRTIVVLEDIVDTGYTMQGLLHTLKSYSPADILVATLFSKPDARKVEVPVDYIGMEIPNRFIVGYGLDYDGHGRNEKAIYTLAE